MYVYTITNATYGATNTATYGCNCPPRDHPYIIWYDGSDRQAEPELPIDLRAAARQAALERSRAHVRWAIPRNAMPIDVDDVAPPRRCAARRREGLRSSARATRNRRRRR